MKRKEFIKNSIVLSTFGAFGGSVLFKAFTVKGRMYFRPPGAAGENEFLSKCIKCSKCVQACPYDSIKSGDLFSGVPSGTPYLEFRDKPCYMCEDIPCVKACPTDALDKKLTDITKAELGTAVIVDREACLSLNGLRCEICYRVCPLIDKAIVLKKHEQEITHKHTVFEPYVMKNVCTGCGMCEHACPLDEPAIKVLKSTRGDKSKHYEGMKSK